MARHEPRVALAHMRDALAAIADYTSEGRDEFFRSRLIQDAVIRNFEILGEAAKQIDSQTRDQHPQVPWKRIAGLRDVLIHHYFGVDLNTVWNVIEKDVPQLATDVGAMLGSLAE